MIHDEGGTTMRSRAVWTVAAWTALIAALICCDIVLAQEGMVGAIDLMTAKGVAEVKGEWRYHEVTTGTGPKHNEIEPKAHGRFDDSTWEVLQPETLGKARGPGKYSWCWYRIQVTIPETVSGKEF